MNSRVWTDRSRMLTYRRCPRMRWLTYHAGGTGLVPAKKSLALVMGTFVHEGLAGLLRQVQGLEADGHNPQLGIAADWAYIEESAVQVALDGWDKYVAEVGVPELESSESLPAPVPVASLTPAQAAADFNMPLGIDVEGLDLYSRAQLRNQSAFEDYTRAEQRALLEGMIRAYARRRLKPLLAEYEVLEVEQEGEWKLADLQSKDYDYLHRPENRLELWFASRADALLLHRETQSLHLLSYKTTGGVDLRKLADIQHDDQGLSEGIEVERRLRKWWENRYNFRNDSRLGDWLISLSAPPRIDAIRYEFLLKGERWKDKQLSQQVGFDVRSQKSPLVKAYIYSGKDPTLFGEMCWSWDYEKPDGSGTGSLNWQNWKSNPVWQTMDTKAWIDLLDKGDGQAVGDAGDALEQQFYPPQIVYRGEDDLRDWVEEVEAQEVDVARKVEAIALINEGNPGLRGALNVLFPKNRSGCEYPGRCAYADKDHGPCYGPAHARSVEAMLESGKYVRREPNHPSEKESWK